MKKPLVILTGPTAVGKTALSIQLAKDIGGEIISADSMQVYKGMDIGSAKIKTEEMQGVPHFLIDEVQPDEEFHVVRFQQLAKKYLKQIWERGHIPVIVGGTGFYIQALLYDIDFTENECDAAYRHELEQLAKEGRIYLVSPSVPMKISRLEENMEKLGHLYARGYKDAKDQMEQLKAYLGMK